MPVDDTTQSKRHALMVALIYLLIRGIPVVLLYVFNTLPAETLTQLVENHGAWLRHIYPVIPQPLLNVPFAFQQALVLLPALIIEVLFVFLFSAWFLRRRPGAVRNTNKSCWIILIVATVIWSYAIRHQLLAYVQSVSIDALHSRQGDAKWITDLPDLLMKANWRLTALIYLTTPLWAWLPAWLHFQCTKRPAKVAEPAGTNDIRNTSATTGMALPLQRATVFASFLLGCIVLHTALVLATYLGLWPWAAEQLRITLPLDMLNEMGLSLSLSQIVFATIMCALAAYVYVRRLQIAPSATLRLFVKPLLAGAAAYLLTCLVFLALVWFVAWLNPGITESLLKQLSRAPGNSIAAVIVLNTAALIMLCVFSGRLRAAPVRWSAVLAVLILCAAIPTYIGWTLAGSNMGIAGGKPGIAVTGKLGDARWRNMEQWCTGVVETSHGTWLVGRRDDISDPVSYVPAGVPDLSKLVTADDEPNRSLYRGLFASRPALTTLSLLQDDGTFKMMATIPDVACMMVSPKSETLFLLTGINSPQSASSLNSQQTAVFRSSDHGITWEWKKSGFMPEVNDLAWDIKPTFATDKDVWAWGQAPSGEDEPNFGWGQTEPVPTRQAADGTELKPTALFYSDDQGDTSTVIYSPEPLIAPVSYLKDMTGQPTADFSNRRDMDQERHVVQITDKRAYAWVSEFMWYYLGEDGHRLMLTTRAELARSGPNDDWVITKVSRQPGVQVKHLSTSLDGRTYAIVQDKEGTWLAKLDVRSGEWIERQRTPSLLPGWLAEDRTSTRYFWSNGDYQVVSQWGDTDVSRLLIPFIKKRAEIDTNAHFYTRDGGRSWHQLAIPGYLGVMGLSPHGSKVYWNKNNWYSNDEPLQWQYDLAK